ncbi:hypothetical protein HDF11_001325 [Tunturiibacter psychrotolerans]
MLTNHMTVFIPASCEPGIPRPTEALRIMPSLVNQIESFEQLALPLFASLDNLAFWLPVTKPSRRPGAGNLLRSTTSV